MQPRLLSGEAVVKKWRANQTRGRTAVGGTLCLTNQRMIFLPHGLERILGRKQWACDIADLSDATVADREAKPFSGGLRRRLMLSGHSGDEYFVINRVDEVPSSIRDAIAST